MSDLKPKLSFRTLDGTLGTCSVLQIFIQTFAAIARLLVGLTRKGIPFKWGDAQRATMIV